jgi:hypothetical protein
MVSKFLNYPSLFLGKKKREKKLQEFKHQLEYNGIYKNIYA